MGIRLSGNHRDSKEWFQRWSTSLILAALLFSPAAAQQPTTEGVEPPKQLLGHLGAINSAIYTPDGRLVATASSDQTIKLWLAETGEELRTLIGHDEQVLGLAIDQQGRMLASASADESIRLWDIPRPDPISHFEGHEGPVGRLAVSPTGRQFLSGADDTTARVWNFGDGSTALTLEGHASPLTSATFRTDNNQIATGDRQGSVRLWSTFDGRFSGELLAHQGPVSWLGYHPNNQSLFTAGAEGTLKQWSLEPLVRRTLAEHAAPVVAVDFNSNSQTAVTASEVIRIINVSDGQTARTIELAEGTSPLVDLDLSPNDQILAASDEAGNVRLWNFSDGAPRGTLRGHVGPIHAVQFHADNARLATAGEDGTLRLWSLPTPAVPLAGSPKPLYAVAASPDGQHIAIAGEEPVIRLFNNSGQATRQLQDERRTNPVQSLAFSRDNALLASGDLAGDVHLHNPSDGSSKSNIGAHSGPVTDLAFAPDGTKLITAGEDGSLKAWRLPLILPKPLAGHGGEVTAVDVSTDGTLTATACVDKLVRLFNENGDSVRNLPALEQPATAVAISADKSLVSAADEAGTIRIFAGGDGSEKGKLRGHVGPVRDVAFHPAGDRLATAGEDGTVRIWQMPQIAKQISGHGATVRQMLLSDDGELLVTGSDDKSVRIWKAADGESAGNIGGQPQAITAVAISKDKSTVAAGDGQGNVRIVQASGGAVKGELKAHETAVTGLALHPSGKLLITSGADGKLRWWELPIKKPEAAEGEEPKPVEPIREVAADPKKVNVLVAAGNKLFTAGEDKLIKVWDIDTGKMSAQLSGMATPATSIDADSSGNLVVACGAETNLYVFNASAGGQPAKFALPANATAACVRSDGSQAAVSTGDNQLTVVETQGLRVLEQFAIPASATALRFVDEHRIAAAIGNNVHVQPLSIKALLAGHEGAVTCLEFTPDGRLASGGADKSLRLWDVDEAKQVAIFAGAGDALTDLDIATESGHLVATSLDNVARIWKLPDAKASGQSVSPSMEIAQPAKVHGIATSADGTRIATAGEDGIVRLWDVATGVELQRYAGHEKPIADVAMPSDASKIISAAADNNAIQFTVAVERLWAQSETPIRAVDSLPDGTALVTGSQQGIAFWNTESGQQRSVENVGSIVDLTIRPDGQQLAVANELGEVHFVSPGDGAIALTLPPPKGEAAPAGNAERPAARVAYSADGTTLLVSRGTAEARLCRVADGQMMEIFAVANPVTDVATLPEANKLVAVGLGEAENAALLTRSVQNVLVVDEEPVTSLTFLPSGQQIAGSTAMGVAVWNLEDGQLVRQFGGASGVTDIAVTGDAQRLLAAAAEGMVHAWQLSAEPAEGGTAVAPEFTLTHASVVHDLDASPDNLKLAATTEDGTIHVWHMATQEKLERFAGHEGPGLSVRFAGDNATLLSGGSDNLAKLWMLSAQQVFALGDGPIKAAAMMQNGTQVLTVSGQEPIARLWNLSDGQQIRGYPTGAETPLLALAARQDNDQIAATDGNTLYLFNASDAAITANIVSESPFTRVRYSDDGTKLVALTEAGGIEFFSSEDGAKLYELSSPESLLDIAFTRDGRRVLTSTAAGKVSLWSYASPEAVQTLNGHGDPVYRLVFNSDGKRLVSASADGTVRIWNTENGSQIKSLAGHQGGVFSVDLSPDGSLIASCGADQTLRLWDALGGRQLKQISAGSAGLYAVEFLPDGQRVAVGGLDKTIRIYDALSGKLQSELTDHNDYIYRLALDPSGKQLLSVGYGGQLILWNPAATQPQFQQDLDRVTNFADLSPNGKRMVVAGGDGYVRFVEVE